MRNALLALTLLASPLASAQDSEPHDNVVIILDASGSMKEPMPGAAGSKMDAAKDALSSVLATLPENTHVGLLVFSQRSTGWAYDLGPRDEVRLKSAVQQAQPSGGTPLGEYIKLGADRLLEERKVEHSYGTYRLLVVTDGQASDERLMDLYAPIVTERGLGFDVIGVAMKGDHKLKRYADSYRSADNAESLVKAVTEVFAEVGANVDTSTQAEVYETVQEIPHELAMAMLEALSSPGGNSPLGK